MEGGIPAVVCSTEPLGLPVEDKTQQKVKLSRRAQKVWHWLERDIAKTLKNNIYTFGNFTTRSAASYANVSVSEASKALAELASLGYLTKVAHGSWELTEITFVNGVVTVDAKDT
jgi:hypothetical protein